VAVFFVLCCCLHIASIITHQLVLFWEKSPKFLLPLTQIPPWSVVEYAAVLSWLLHLLCCDTLYSIDVADLLLQLKLAGSYSYWLPATFCCCCCLCNCTRYKGLWIVSSSPYWLALDALVELLLQLIWSGDAWWQNLHHLGGVTINCYSAYCNFHCCIYANNDVHIILQWLLGCFFDPFLKEGSKGHAPSLYMPLHDNSHPASTTIQHLVRVVHSIYHHWLAWTWHVLGHEGYITIATSS